MGPERPVVQIHPVLLMAVEQHIKVGQGKAVKSHPDCRHTPVAERLSTDCKEVRDAGSNPARCAT